MKYRPDERVEAEREHRRKEGQVRLEDPRGIGADQPRAHTERQQCSGRIALSEVDRQRRLVGRRVEPVQLAAVLEHPIREGEKGRSVVELDVAGKRRLAGRKDRRSDGDERDEGAARGVRVDPAESAEAEPEAKHGESDEHRHRELRGPTRRRCEARNDRHHHEPDRHKERPRNAAPGGSLEDERTPEGDGSEGEREPDPGEKQRHGLLFSEPRRYGTGRTRPVSTTRRASTGDGE